MIKLLVLIGLLCVMTTAEAKQKISKQAKESPRVLSDFKRLDINEIRNDIKNGKISKNYNNFPLDVAIENIEKIIKISPKGDFETSNDFEKRKNDAFRKKIINDISINDLVTFSFSINNWKDYGYHKCIMEFGYDADSSKLSIHWTPKNRVLNNIGAPDYMYNINEEFDKLNSFECYNHGEQKKLGYELTDYGIATDYIESIKNSTIGYYNEKDEAFVDLIVNSKDAENFVSDLSVMIVLKPKYPFLYFHYHEIKPDGLYIYKYIYGDILYAVVFSKKTGDIFKVLSNDVLSVDSVQ